MIGQLATQTGWTVDYILKHVNVVLLQLMTADLPRYVGPHRPGPAELIRRLEERERQRGNPPPSTGQKGVNPMTYFQDMAVKD